MSVRIFPPVQRHITSAGGVNIMRNAPSTATNTQRVPNGNNSFASLKNHCKQESRNWGSPQQKQRTQSKSNMFQSANGSLGPWDHQIVHTQNGSKTGFTVSVRPLHTLRPFL